MPSVPHGDFRMFEELLEVTRALPLGSTVDQAQHGDISPDSQGGQLEFYQCSQVINANPSQNLLCTESNRDNIERSA